MKRDYLGTGMQASFKFAWTCYAAGMMHVVFLLTFLHFDMGMLATANCFSIFLYILGGTITRHTDMSKHALAWIIAIYMEILLHAVFCTLVQGLEVSFFYFPLVAMPLYAYYLFMYCKKWTFIKTIITMGVVTLLVMAGVILFVEYVGTLFSLVNMHVLSHTEIMAFRGINITFTFCIVLAFTVIFCVEVMQLIGRLTYIASHDSMTGLANRRSLWSFFEELEQSGDKYCIIMGDLDDFKKINDTYGHGCGDEVLESVARIILGRTTSDEMACRWGGEEIVIVMRGTRAECLKRVMEIKSEICALHIVHENRQVNVTMTFGFADCEEIASLAAASSREAAEGAIQEQEKHGVSTAPSNIRPRPDIDMLIPIVDGRLYVGKHSGKNIIISA